MADKVIEFGDKVKAPKFKMHGIVKKFQSNGRVGVNFCGCCDEVYYFHPSELKVIYNG